MTRFIAPAEPAERYNNNLNSARVEQLNNSALAELGLWSIRYRRFRASRSTDGYSHYVPIGTFKRGLTPALNLQTPKFCEAKLPQIHNPKLKNNPKSINRRSLKRY